jgi:hypothetical protein
VSKISKEDIYQVLSGRYPSIDFVFLYGSVQRGTATALSDIDCVVLTTDTIRPYRECFADSGRLFDVYVFDPASLNAALRRCSAVGEPMLIHAVASAEALPTANDVSEKLLAIARELSAVPFEPPPAMIRTLRQALTSVLDDLTVEISGFERTMRLVELMMAVAQSRMLMCGAGSRSFRYMGRVLSEHDQTGTAELDAAFQEALGGAQQQLVDLGQRMLDALGGAFREGYKTPLPELPRIAL